MKFRLLVPLAAILLMETVLLVLFYLFGGVSKSLRDNAVEILIEHTRNGRMSLEQELVQHWIYRLRDQHEVVQMIETTLEEQGKTSGAIATDGELNEAILYSAVDYLVRRLQYSEGDGIYLVLNGPSVESETAQDRAGVRIWISEDMSDPWNAKAFYLKNGSRRIAQEYHMTITEGWNPVFSEAAEGLGKYYRQPYSDELNPQTKMPYGCLEAWTARGGSAVELSYSMPLILSDGTVIGIIGGEMTDRRLSGTLQGEEPSEDTEILQFMGVREPKTGALQPVLGISREFARNFGEESSFVLQPTEWEKLGKLHDRDGRLWYVGVELLDIFESGNPYVREQWVTARMMPADRLFAGVEHVRRLLVLSLLISMLMGLSALVMAGNALTGPIRKLLDELKQVRQQRGGRLKATNISEVDTLIEEINSLNGELEKEAFRISRILDVSGVPIGVFEYSSGTGQVFCSRSLLQLLELPHQDEQYVYMSWDKFVQSMLVLRNPREEAEGRVYEFESGSGLRYIRLKKVGDPKESVTGVLSDVTIEVNERRKLERERNYDLLTNLYNRRAFREKVEWLIRRQRPRDMAVVMWDLDNLKYVNDTYGHETGDRYIRLFADYLRTLEFDGAIVERHSGDEFMAVLYNGDENSLWARILDFMERLKGVRLKVPDGYELPLRASAGVVWYPRQAHDFDTLVRYADFAMYMSKQNDKGAVREFVPEIYQANAYQLSGKEELNVFLEKHLVEFALQPIIARDGSLYGYEALMRPHLKTLKNVQELLTLAKLQSKLPQMEELTWTGALAWISNRLPELGEGSRFFINSIASVSLPDEMFDALEQRYGSLLSRVVMEITETEQCDEDCLNRKLEAVRRWNGLLALNDYGSGYSGEGNLLRICPDLVKMDLELVRNVHNDENRQTIVKNLIAYCHQRGILVLAEGVESPQELELLIDLEVDLFQGFYLAQPGQGIGAANQEVIEKMRKISKK